MSAKLRGAGARLMAGGPGPHMEDDYRALARTYGLCNFILFARDIVDEKQLRALCDELHALARENSGRGALIAIDQEGGRVQRLPKALLDTDAAGELAALGEMHVEETGHHIGRTLRALGVNFDLAPVLDVDFPNGNKVVGDRSFGKTPEEAARNGCAMMRGLMRGGVLACAKHFPGHGGTRADSHVELPTLDFTLEELRKGPLVPFRAAIGAGVRAVMSAHILFRNIDPAHPATMSRRLLTDILRGELGFRGVIMTDCLEMAAIAANFGSAAGAKAAALAGADLMLVSNTRGLIIESAEMLDRAVCDGEIEDAEHQHALNRIGEAKTWLGL